MSRSPTGGPAWNDDLSADARAAVAPVLDPTEVVDAVAAAVGCVMILTRRRLVIVRDGANFRPKTGVRWFDLDHSLAIRIGPGRRRIIIESAGTTINVFVRAEQLEQAEQLVAEIRRRIVLG